MIYNRFGKTGTNISALGFGAMRLPTAAVDGKKIIDEDKAIQVIRKAYDLGVNYFDTAYIYHGGQSETVLGKALKGIRDKVYISTKFPFYEDTDISTYRRTLEGQLKKLDTDHVDFYHFHGISKELFINSIEKNGYIEEAVKAKDEGMIKHISFSFHDDPDSIKFLVDTGCFETILCQYNFMDRSNEQGMAYAKKKGLGVVVMGPLAGGRIAGMPPEIAKKLGIKVKNTSELAFRFVFSNPNVDCALSGMNSIAMAEENAETASRSDKPLTDREVSSIKNLMDEYRRLSELYCTGCDYCRPCPNGVNISYIFSLMNNYRIYGLRDQAREEYAMIGCPSGAEGEKADRCEECGICEGKCPQKIEIIKQLKECGNVLG
jgi:uncharacterized protein